MRLTSQDAATAMAISKATVAQAVVTRGVATTDTVLTIIQLANLARDTAGSRQAKAALIVPLHDGRIDADGQSGDGSECPHIAMQIQSVIKR